MRLIPFEGELDAPVPLPASPKIIPFDGVLDHELETPSSQFNDPRNLKEKFSDAFEVLGHSLKNTGNAVGVGALNIAPAVVKSAGDVAQLATGGALGTGLSKEASNWMEGVKDKYSTDDNKAASQRFGEVMSDNNKGFGDMLGAVVDNPTHALTEGVSTLGSMALPMGVSGAATKIASLLGGGAKAVNAASIAGATAANTAMNAGDTYSTVRDKSGSQADAYRGAALSALASLVAGKITGGGAEAMAGRALAGQLEKATGNAGLNLLKTGYKEGVQNAGEEVGNWAGENVGLGNEWLANDISKRAGFAWLLGSAVGSGTHLAVHGRGIEQSPESIQAQRIKQTVETVGKLIGKEEANRAATMVATQRAEEARRAQDVADKQIAQTVTDLIKANTLSKDNKAVAEAIKPQPATVEALAAQNEEWQAYQNERSAPKQMEGEAAQNRNRASVDSVAQMNAIAANPDYMRVAPGKLLSEGAPVVSNGGVAIDPAQIGRTDIAIDAEGKRYPVQYAVIEGDQALTSNAADGSAMAGYGPSNMQQGQIKALAGNGRLAGLRQAYSQGTAATYKTELAADAASHGISAETINAMRAPVLVRVATQPNALPSNFGDVSNRAGTLARSPLETARDDARRLDLNRLDFNAAGGVSPQTMHQFVAGLPANEARAVRDDQGAPTKQAYDRLEAAIFYRAYNDDGLLQIVAESRSPEARRLLNAMLAAAPQMAQLEGHGVFDQRGAVVDAAKAVVKAMRDGMKAADYARQLDLDQHPNAKYVLDLYVATQHSENKIADGLISLAKRLYDESVKPAQDMFGDVAKRTPESMYKDVIDEQQDPPSYSRKRSDPYSAQLPFDAGNYGRSMQGDRAEPTRLGGGTAIERGTREETSTTPRSGEDYALEGYSKQDILGRQAQADVIAKQQEIKQQALDKRAQADAGRNDFSLTGSNRAADIGASRGQGALFARNKVDAPNKTTATEISAMLKREYPRAKVAVYDAVVDVPAPMLSRIERAGAYDVEGYFDPKSDEVALIADNLPTLARAIEVARHEVIGHYGVDGLVKEAVGDTGWNMVIQRVITAEQAGNATLKKYAAKVDAAQPDLSPESRAREIIAQMAEHNEHSLMPVKRVFEGMRKLLARMGLVNPQKDMTDAYLADLLRGAREYVNSKDGMHDNHGSNQRINQSIESAIDNALGDRASKINIVSSEEAHNNLSGMEKLMTAWHGSPHDFDKFTTEKIGAGEGAQVYGYGLYFAGNKKVALHYKNKLSKLKYIGKNRNVTAEIRDNIGEVSYSDNVSYEEAAKYIASNLNARIEEAKELIRQRDDKLNEINKIVKSDGVISRTIETKARNTPVLKEGESNDIGPNNKTFVDNINKLNGANTITYDIDYKNKRYIEIKNIKIQSNQTITADDIIYDELKILGKVKNRDEYEERKDDFDKYLTFPKKVRAFVDEYKTNNHYETIYYVPQFEREKLESLHPELRLSEELKEIYRKSGWFGDNTIKDYEDKIKIYLSVKNSDFIRGKLYKVDLKPEEDEYLLWDKTFLDQSDKVKSALNELEKDDFFGHVVTRFKNQKDSKIETGGELVKELENKTFAKRVSLKLKSIGIRGVKYLDGSSRSKGEGNYNYVIFDDADVDIINKESRLGNNVEGFFNPRTGEINIIADNIKPIGNMTAEQRAVWVAWHEMFHRGMDTGVMNGRYKNIIAQANTNAMVRKLAGEIKNDRVNLSEELAIEESLAELRAAMDTGNWQHLSDRYGIELTNLKKSIAKTGVDKFIAAVRRFMADVLGIKASLTDGEVMDLVRNVAAQDTDEVVKKEPPIVEENSKERFGLTQSKDSPKSIERLSKAPKGKTIKLYRGITQEFDTNYDTSKSDAPNGYSTWTDNIELAKEYAGNGGRVYSIELPINKMGKELIDNDGERALFVDNEKGAGINGKAGKEYLVYTDHENYSADLIKEVVKKETPIVEDNSKERPDEQVDLEKSNNLPDLSKPLIQRNKAGSDRGEEDDNGYFKSSQSPRDTEADRLEAWRRDPTQMPLGIPISDDSGIRPREKIEAKDFVTFNKDGKGGRQYESGRKLYANTAAVVRKLLSAKYVRLADNSPPAFKQLMRQYNVKNDQAAATALNIGQVGMQLPAEQRVMISEIIEGQLKNGDVPPEHIAKLATDISTEIEANGRRLVELGMLRQEELTENYLPRFYKNGLLASVNSANLLKDWFVKARMSIKGERLQSRGIFEDVPTGEVETFKKLGWQIAKFDEHRNLYAPQPELLKDPTAKVRMWRDYMAVERARMGEVRDGVFRFALAHTNAAKDIAMGELFRATARNRALAKPYNPGGWKHIPKSETPGNVAYRYGELAGMWVHPDVAYALEKSTQPKGEMLAAYDKAMGLWKELMTIWNPLTHGNNISSNLFVAHFAGLNPFSPTMWRETIKEIKNKGQYYQEGVGNGLFGSDFTHIELQHLLKPELEKLIDPATILADRQNKVTALLTKVGKPIGWMRQKMQAVYQAEDQFFKMAIYIDRRKNGMDTQDAIDEAERYLFNYADVPKGVDIIKRTVSPFFSWTYKALPMMLYTATNYPHRLILPIALLGGANWLSYYILGAAGDEEDERKNMNEQMKGRSAIGTLKSVRLPFNLGGDATFVDLSRRIPLGDLFDTQNQTNGLPIPQPFMPSNPVLSLLGALLWNVETFTGRDLVKNTDTGWEAAGKRAKYLWQQLTPNNALVPGSYAQEKLLNGIAHDFDTNMLGYTGMSRSGQSVHLGEALSAVTGLAKIRHFDPAKNASYKQYQVKKEIDEINANIRSIQRDQSISPEKRARAIEAQRDKLLQVREQSGNVD